MHTIRILMRYPLLVLTLSLFCLHLAHAVESPLRVTTDKGVVVGLTTDYGAKYLGIPYAAPPVGALRWQPTQEASAWTGEYSANKFGAGCPQKASPFGRASNTEDCLFLNVYRPLSSRKAGLPVMVWFHGGAFIYGEGDDFDPARLVKKDVIVVTLNYRIGVLGFMSHPALSAKSASGTSGNFGLMDQQAALRWVQKNIAAFGGNPHNVTIFGQSAGGMSVHAHLVSPGSKGLFHHAIIQSGAYLLDMPPMWVWSLSGMQMSSDMGCDDQSADCLLSLSVEDILEKAQPGPLGFIPVVDGKLVPQTIRKALAAGNFNKVPVLEGSTHDEYSMFVGLQFSLAGNPLTPDNYVKSMSALQFWPWQSLRVATKYPLKNYSAPGEAYTAVGTDFLFACNSQASLRLLANTVPTYGYEFNDPNVPFTILPPIEFPYRSSHISEIQYVMDPRELPPFTSEQIRLSEHMVNYWTSFAKYGTPNLSGSPYWPRYTKLEKMKSLQPPTPITFDNFNEAHQCDFWRDL